MILNLYKQRGETPLECIERFKKKNTEYANKKMTYLGRLDPLAEGVLLVGTDNDTKQENREKFFGLDKCYEFIAIFGFATDTYDVLGKVVKDEDVQDLNILDLKKLATIYEGEREQKYPLYSSKMLSKKEPSEEVRKIKIYKLDLEKLDTLTSKELLGRLFMDISKVKGDFRQTEILELWQKKLIKNLNKKIFLAHFRAEVSSGTYIRSLVNEMGSTLGCGATTLHIRRTRVGDYEIENST